MSWAKYEAGLGHLRKRAFSKGRRVGKGRQYRLESFLATNSIPPLDALFQSLSQPYLASYFRILSILLPLAPLSSTVPEAVDRPRAVPEPKWASAAYFEPIGIALPADQIGFHRTGLHMSKHQ